MSLVGSPGCFIRSNHPPSFPCKNRCERNPAVCNRKVYCTQIPMVGGGDRIYSGMTTLLARSDSIAQHEASLMHRHSTGLCSVCETVCVAHARRLTVPPSRTHAGTGRLGFGVSCRASRTPSHGKVHGAPAQLSDGGGPQTHRRVSPSQTHRRVSPDGHPTTRQGVQERHAAQPRICSESGGPGMIRFAAGPTGQPAAARLAGAASVRVY